MQKLDYAFCSGIFIKQVSAFAIGGFAGLYAADLTNRVSIPYPEPRAALNYGISMTSC
jgi:hypothetical protein